MTIDRRVMRTRTTIYDALVDLIRAETHTCYLGRRGELHHWGYGCGDCPACRLRAEGYARYAEAR